ncbi:MAG: hypothetical protein IKB56_01365 [Clostridia bacterium]|nr:hypothetical protein [Clostridia bacterium]
MLKLSCLSVGIPEELLLQLKSCRPYELTFSASANDVQEGELLLEKLIVQAILIYSERRDEQVNKFIGFCKSLPSRPIVSVITQNKSDYEEIAHLTLASSESAPDMASKLLRLPLEKRETIEITTSKEKLLDERLANIFISAGIPPHIKGYQFLREAVKQAVTDPSMINNITKMLYPAVAQRFNTSPSKVERAIRHAIEVAWSRGKIENINNIYGIKIFSRGDKPTNGELIALVSDKLLIECS